MVCFAHWMSDQNRRKKQCCWGDLSELKNVKWLSSTNCSQPPQGLCNNKEKKLSVLLGKRTAVIVSRQTSCCTDEVLVEMIFFSDISTLLLIFSQLLSRCHGGGDWVFCGSLQELKPDHPPLSASQPCPVHKYLTLKPWLGGSPQPHMNSWGNVSWNINALFILMLGCLEKWADNHDPRSLYVACVASHFC